MTIMDGSGSRCRDCGEPIVFSEGRWKHVGLLTPRHLAIPWGEIFPPVSTAGAAEAPPHGGLTETEKRVLKALEDVCRAWFDLNHKHPADDREFEFSIHALQCMIGWRVARRVDPDQWNQATVNEVPRG